MPQSDSSDAELRQQMKDAVVKSTDPPLTDAEAEVVMQRIADRLGGYTHAEVVEMHPMPGESDAA